jgi:hypothetical protein
MYCARSRVSHHQRFPERKDTYSVSSPSQRSELTFVVSPFIMPFREKTRGWNGRLLPGRCQILWSATMSRYLSISREGLLSLSGRVVLRASLLECETTVRS